MRTVSDRVVIIGGGLAGAKTAERLRKRGYPGAITLVSAESQLPYERPPLSKGYLAGREDFDKAIVHPEAWYREHDIDLRCGVRASAINPDAHMVRLVDGTDVPYGNLVLATGSTPRQFPSGASAANIHTLRNKEDADAIRSAMRDGKRLVIIGGGWIGLEVAAAASDAGALVTVLERSGLPLQSVLGPEIARVFVDLHRSHGVTIRTGTLVDEIVLADGVATGIRLEGGELLDADAIIVGIGATPNIELAADAGLAVENGILVDKVLRTSDPDIYAVGDIANHDHPVLGRRLRVEHWAAARTQPKTVAASIMGDDDAAYTALPYFYTDQYDLGMEYSGYAPEGTYDQVIIRGDLVGREFIAFWLKDQRVIAGMNVNIWDVNEAVQDLIHRGNAVDPVRLADPDVPLEGL